MDHQQLWEEVSEIIKNEIGEQAFSTWFKNTGIQSLDENELVICADNEFAVDWVRTKYLKLIQRSACKIIKKEVSITITSKQGEEAVNTINSLL